jgi:hypothetical protein
MRICGCLRDTLEEVEASHASLKIKEQAAAFNAKEKNRKF